MLNACTSEIKSRILVSYHARLDEPISGCGSSPRDEEHIFTRHTHEKHPLIPKYSEGSN